MERDSERSGHEGRRDAANSTTPTAEERTATSATEEIDGVKFHGHRCAIYYSSREGFLETCHKLTMVVVAFSSSAAIVAVFNGHDTLAMILPAVSAVAGVLDMALGYSEQARRHASLATRFNLLVADALTLKEYEPGALQARLEKLYGDCPPTFKAVDALAHNQECDARDQSEYGLIVPYPYRLLRHFLKFDGTTFKRKMGSGDVAEAG